MHNLNISKTDLVQLLNVAMKNQLFQFNGLLYEQIDGVTIGSPLGPLLANVFMCSIEDNIQRIGQMPPFYKRYVDDTLTSTPDETSANTFLETLNTRHPSIQFTMEMSTNNALPFLGVELLKNGSQIETKVYVKPTNSGLLLHYQSHVDFRYKRALIKTMLNRAYQLSSSWEYFSKECVRLKDLFSKLQYPAHLVDNTISKFLTSVKTTTERTSHTISHDESVFT